MIGTFWSLCRACPSVPVDKLHSEYRSTYRWHEYTGPRQEIIRKPPQNTTIGQAAEPALHRRRKHPELAYRAHDFLVSVDGGSNSLLEKTYDRARSEERWRASRQKSSRRSKSEGPPAGQPSYRLIYTKSNTNQHNKKEIYINDENVAPTNAINDGRKMIKTEKEAGKGGSEYRLQFAWPPAGKVLNTRVSDIHASNTPRKSISMNGLKNRGAQEAVPVHKRTPANQNQTEMEVLRTLKPNTDLENVQTDERAQKVEASDKISSNNEFKSEYRKNFQPFNKYDFDENKGVFEKRMLDPVYNQESEAESPSSSWYKEVVLLRKKANQYRHRGWGTELVPDHIAQLYNNQMMVWEQVSRRSTLSALSLASTIITKNRSVTKEEKEKENRKHSPSKSLSRLRSKTSHDSSGNHESRNNEKKNLAHVRNIITKTRMEHSPEKGNTRLKRSMVERSSPKNSSRSVSSSAAPAIHAKVPAQGSEKPKRRPRPTSLVTSVPSGSKTSFGQLKKKDGNGKLMLLDNCGHGPRHGVIYLSKPIDVSKEENESGAEDVPNFPEVTEEQIVKSPPEPTRVKSPEQIVMRSPEPVNWTVPLDTGKTFTVTQNVREGDLVPRSYSEARAYTPTSAPPPASISAPTELLELAKANANG